MKHKAPALAPIGIFLRRECRHCFFFNQSKRTGKYFCLHNCGNRGKHLNADCCEKYRPRWLGRLGIKVMCWRFKAMHITSRIWCRCVRIPIGSRRAPVAIGWQDAYNPHTDSIDKDAYPECPYCGEMPYSYEQCQFCGQRFVKEKTP